MAIERKYDGPIRPGMIFTAPDNDGEFGYRRVKVVATDPEDGLLILKEMPGRIRYAQVGSIFKCPEVNLRIVFFLEGEVGIAEPPERPPICAT